MDGETNSSDVENSAEKNFRIVGALERAIDEIDLTLASGSNLVLDFGACSFVSVEGLEWLEEVMLRSESSGVSVVFVNLDPKVYKVFKVAHIDSLLRACGAPSSKNNIPSC